MATHLMTETEEYSIWTNMKTRWSVEAAFNEATRPPERILTLNGKSQSIAAWSKELRISSSTIRNRMDVIKLDMTEVLSPDKRPVSNQFLKKVV